MDLRGAGAGMQGCHKSTIVPLWLGRETAAPTQPLRLLSAGLAGDVKLHPVFNQACEGVPSLLAARVLQVMASVAGAAKRASTATILIVSVQPDKFKADGRCCAAAIIACRWPPHQQLPVRAPATA